LFVAEFDVLLNPQPHFPAAFKDRIHPRILVESSLVRSAKFCEISEHSFRHRTLRIKDLLVGQLSAEEKAFRLL
jgi:hypothetical protein